ncbi:MAG: 50S ribosomal protein L10 [Bacilli bacterium]|nr:50S ribosomal protein L10 [Bacilli bacterium]MDD4808862.1 50S ribosomal protein L10 [Bacilli bacterium]
MANQETLTKKQDVVEEIVSKVKESSSVLFFEYNGLKVREISELRRALRDVDSDLKVYKNTLARRALGKLDYQMDDDLTGQKAIVFGTDMIAPIKVLSEYSKKYPALEIKAGIVDGKITDLNMLKKLAVVPSKEESMTMFAMGLLQPLKNFAIGLDLYSKKIEK